MSKFGAALLHDATTVDLTSATEALKTTMTNAMSTAATNMLDYVGVALPIALTVGGTIMAVRFGWSFFRGMAH